MSKHHKEAGSRVGWNVARESAKNRDKWRCRKCGKAGLLEVHHIQGLADGGSHDLINLQTLCRECHIALHKPILSNADKMWLLFVEELA